MGKGQRLNPQTAVVIKDCLRAGATPSQVLLALNQHAIDKHYTEGLLPRYVATSEMIRGFYERLKSSKRVSANDFDNVMALRDLVGNDCIQVFFPTFEEGRGCVPLLIFLMTPAMAAMASNLHNGQGLMQIDGTFNIDGYNYVVYVFLVVEEDNHGFPVAIAVIDTKAKEPLADAARLLLKKAPGCSPRAVGMDGGKEIEAMVDQLNLEGLWR
jgi:hypothetical protein